MQNLFNFRPFPKTEKYMMQLNTFIEKNKPTVEHYFNSLVKVDDPEDHLQARGIQGDSTHAHISP